MITDRDGVAAPLPRDVWISPVYGRVEVRFVDPDHVYVKSDKLEFSPTPRHPPRHWNGSHYIGRMLGAFVAAKRKWGSTFFTPHVAWMGRTNGLHGTLEPKDACWSLYTINKYEERAQWDLPEALTLGVECGPNETLTDMSPAAHAWALWTLLTTISADGRLP